MYQCLHFVAVLGVQGVYHSTLALAEEKGNHKVYLKHTIDVHNVSKAISRKLKD